MDNISYAKKHLENFIIKKKKNSKNLTSKLYHDILELKRLDNHIREFSKMVDKDIKENNNEVFIHAKKFEKAIHKELDELFKLSKEDLKLYYSILRNLNDYKNKIFENTKSQRFGLTKIEMKYAKMNIDSIERKLDDLKKIFKELK